MLEIMLLKAIKRKLSALYPSYNSSVVKDTKRYLFHLLSWRLLYNNASKTVL